MTDKPGDLEKVTRKPNPHSDHMYYPDLPCWCGGEPAFGMPHDFTAVRKNK